MSQLRQNQATNAEIADSNWKSLYKFGGAAATTDAQRSMLLAAGQAMLAIYNGTAFKLSYVFQAVAGITISVVMLCSNIFSRVTAYVGIRAGVIAFDLFIPKIGIFISIFSILFYEIWYILIARKLLQLGRTVSKEELNRIGGISQ